MSNYLKCTILFFAILLSFSSMSKDPYGQLLSTAAADIKADYTSPSSEISLSEGFCLFGVSEIVENSVNHLPAPDSKNNLKSFSGNSVSAESKIQAIALQYLFHLQGRNPGLLVRTIIFPFHYFW